MSTRRFATWIASVALIVVVSFAAGCGRHAATDADCRAILDRLVELELAEVGFRDPVIRARWKDQVAKKFAAEFARCRGRRVPDDLAACLAHATTQEEIAHVCLP